MPTRPKPLNGLRHLALVVDDLEAVERFYVDLMGMTLLRRASENLVYLTLGNDNLSLGRKKPDDSEPTGMRGNLDHFGFIVDSREELDQWYAYLKAQGADLIDTPFDHTDGARSFHVRDPAGNVVQPLYHPAVSGQTFSSPSSS